MNDFTKEEEKFLIAISNPLYSFIEVQKVLDETAVDLGYKSHDDLLDKTGWHERFVTNE